MARTLEAGMRRKPSLNRNFLSNAEPVLEGFSVPGLIIFKVSFVAGREAALEIFSANFLSFSKG